VTKSKEQHSEVAKSYKRLKESAKMLIKNIESNDNYQEQEVIYIYKK
jgi:hypothetical protein